MNSGKILASVFMVCALIIGPVFASKSETRELNSFEQDERRRALMAIKGDPHPMQHVDFSQSLEGLKKETTRQIDFYLNAQDEGLGRAVVAVHTYLDFLASCSQKILGGLNFDEICKRRLAPKEEASTQDVLDSFTNKFWLAQHLSGSHESSQGNSSTNINTQPEVHVFPKTDKWQALAQYLHPRLAFWNIHALHFGKELIPLYAIPDTPDDKAVREYVLSTSDQHALEVAFKIAADEAAEAVDFDRTKFLMMVYQDIQIKRFQELCKSYDKQKGPLIELADTLVETAIDVANACVLCEDYTTAVALLERGIAQHLERAETVSKLAALSDKEKDTKANQGLSEIYDTYLLLLYECKDWKKIRELLNEKDRLKILTKESLQTIFVAVGEELIETNAKANKLLDEAATLKTELKHIYGYMPKKSGCSRFLDAIYKLWSPAADK